MAQIKSVGNVEKRRRRRLRLRDLHFSFAVVAVVTLKNRTLSPAAQHFTVRALLQPRWSEDRTTLIVPGPGPYLEKLAEFLPAAGQAIRC
jgi:hypothetical protein